MLVIRLRRIGKKNKPSYRIVVAEHSFPIDGRFVEDLGYYNPHTKTTGLDKKKATDWMNKGAKPSNTVAKLLKNEKVKHASIVVVEKAKKAKKSEEKEEKKAETTPATEAPTENTKEEKPTENQEQKEGASEKDTKEIQEKKDS